MAMGYSMTKRNKIGAHLLPTREFVADDPTTVPVQYP